MNLRIYYDGDCPFCSKYARLVALRRAIGTVELIDLRMNHAERERLTAAGFDLNDGMVVETSEQTYHGADAMHVIALLSSKLGPVFGNAFKKRAFARAVYPLLRAGRNLTLTVLGGKKL